MPHSKIIKFLNFLLICRDISLWPFLSNFLSSTTFILWNFLYDEVKNFDKRIMMKIFNLILCVRTSYLIPIPNFKFLAKLTTKGVGAGSDKQKIVPSIIPRQFLTINHRELDTGCYTHFCRFLLPCKKTLKLAQEWLFWDLCIRLTLLVKQEFYSWERRPWLIEVLIGLV